MWRAEHSVDDLQPRLVTVWSVLWPEVAAEHLEAVAEVGDIVDVLALQLLLAEVLDELEGKLHAGGEAALGHLWQEEVGAVGQRVEQGGHGPGGQLLRLLELLLDQGEALLVPKLVDQITEPAVLFAVVGVWCFRSLCILRPVAREMIMSNSKEIL